MREVNLSRSKADEWGGSEKAEDPTITSQELVRSPARHIPLEVTD